MQEREIFDAALAIADPAERSAYLKQACGGDAAQKDHIEELLEMQGQLGSFLQAPAAALAGTVADSASDRPGAIIGPYKLLEQIGEGGFGVVYMAEQSQPLRRKVALKIVKPGMDTRQVVARFEAERQALAIMDHPNIAHVFDGGEIASGRPYFVMELVRGVPITEFCDRNHLPVRERLKLFVHVCQAVQHAHQKGIIHRDLKPTNVLVTLHDGKPVVKVIDFGIAKAMGRQLTEKTLFTNFAQMIGTPLYMSPEQAEMSGLDVDTRSDIYSLGVLLYELLTGTTPFDKERFKELGYDELRRIIREEEPARPSTRISTLGQAASTVSTNRQSDPSRLCQLFRGELDWIVMKALEKDRSRRYETAGALAADVQRYLDDEPVQACPPSAWYRIRKFARRKKTLFMTASIIAAALLVAVTAMAVSGVLVWQTNYELQLNLYFHRIALAHRELSVDNLHGALKLLEACPQDLRDWEWHYLMRRGLVEPLVIRDEKKTEFNGLAFSPDGDRLASAGGDGFITIWNSATGKVLHAFRAHSDTVVSVAFHRDGMHLASRGADGKLNVWDLTATREPVWTEPCDAPRKFGTAYTVAFSADGRLLAAETGGEVRVWDWKNRKLLPSMPGYEFHSVPLAFSSDGRLATGAFREGLKLYDPTVGKLLCTMHTHDHPVSGLAFSPDGKWLAAASFGRTVKVFDSTSGRLRTNFDLHTGNVECVAFSRNGRLVASGGEDKTVRVWEAATGREVLGLHGHTDRCACVAFSPDGWRLASASADGTIRFWDATPLQGNEGEETHTFTEHSDEIRCVAASPDGQRIASAGQDGFVKVWDAQTGHVSAEFSHGDVRGQNVAVFCVAWRPNGHHIASAALLAVTVWDARTEREAFKLPASLGKIALPYQAVAFSPDGRYLVTGKVDGAVQVWDGETGDKVGTLAAHKQVIRGVVFSKCGKHLASASSDGEVKLWDAKRLDKKSLDEKQEARPVLRARVAGPGLSVAFSPDGRRLATGGEENTVKIRDVQTGEELLPPLRGHKGDVYTVAFSPDDSGRWIASAGEDSVVKIWDSHTGKLIHNFRGHRGIVSSLAFSSDGQLLVSGSRDRTVKVWDLTKLDKE